MLRGRTLVSLREKHVDCDVDGVAKSLEGGCNAIVYYSSITLALIGNERATGYCIDKVCTLL